MRSAQGARVFAEDMQQLFSSALPWARLDGKTVLVTGAMGLVANYMVEALLFRNEHSAATPSRVLALVRNADAARLHFARNLQREDFDLVVQDVCTPLPAGLQCHFIIHAAGNATPRKFGQDPVGTYKAAVLGTHALLAHANATGCEGFLLLSSGAVHGAVQGESSVVTETLMGTIDPLDPYACYAESKRMAETICASWTRQYGIRTLMARLGHSYGPGLRRDDDRAFAEFLFAALDRRDIVLHTDGSAVRAFCYLKDVTDGLLRILLCGNDGEAYLVVNEHASCSIRELAHLIAGIDPRHPVQVHFKGPGGAGAIANKDPARPHDSSKLRALGWAPHTSIQHGFERTFRSLT